MIFFIIRSCCIANKVYFLGERKNKINQIALIKFDHKLLWENLFFALQIHELYLYEC